MATAEQSAIERADANSVSTQEMPAGWRVIIARAGERVRTWYYHPNDDSRLIAALNNTAAEWFAAAQTA